MKKSAVVLAFVVFALLVLSGCELLKLSDLKGEWEFPALTQIGGNAIHEAHLSVLDIEGSVKLDISWYAGSDPADDSVQAFYMADGSMDGSTFTGTYVTNLFEDPPYNLTVKFSKSGGKLKIEATGTGPLNGITMTGGELAAVE